MDFKAGYHHWLLAPEHWTYVGVQWEGQIYVHAALPFGISQAPRIFTQIVQTMYAPLRRWHLPVTYMIDDSAGSAASLTVACWRLLFHVLVVVLLGWFVGRGKSSSWPVQWFKFLGFMVDLQRGALWIPEQKLQRFALLLTEWQRTQHPRLLATACGQLASFGPALRMAPLLVRALRAEAEMLQPAARSSQVQQLVLGTEFWLFWEKKLALLHGRPWAPPVSTTLQLVVDTSKGHFGGYVPGTGWRLTVPFDEEQQRSFAQAHDASTVRELAGMLVATQQLLLTRRHWLPRGSTLQLISDSAGGCSVLLYMRGGRTTFPWVARIHLLLAEHGVALEVSWQPRETAAIRAADALSKPVDPADWRLSWRYVDTQIASRARAALPTQMKWPPAVDLFASCEAHQRCCAHYYAEVYDARCTAADAFLQDWAALPGSYPPVRSQPAPLVFAFPPVRLLPRVLAKIRADRANALLVCPQRQYLQEEESHDIDRLPVRAAWPLWSGSGPMVTPTSRVPAAVRRGGWKTPLQAVLVCWVT